MKVIPTAAVLGAEIAEVDLSRQLDDATFAAIERAYDEYGVIFFRGQSITPAQQVAFTRRFGEIEFNIFGGRWSVPGNPEIVVLSNITEGGRPTGVRRAGENWHSDMCYTARPPRGTILYAIEVPELHGLPLGDTEFASAAAAWDALPDAMKRSLEGRRAVFDFRGRKRALTPTQAEIDRNPPVRHPIVRTHPRTGRKCLYVMRDDCTGVEGMEARRGGGVDRGPGGSHHQARVRVSPPVAAGRRADVGQLHGPAPGDPGLRHAPAPLDASHDDGWRGPRVAAARP